MDFELAVQNLNDLKSSLDNSEVSHLVFELINGRESPLGVVEAITLQYKSKDATAEHLNDVQTIIMRIAAEVPFAQASAVALVEALYHCSDKDVHMEFWGAFGMDMGDYHSSVAHIQEDSEAYINFNGFEAKLWQAMGEESEPYIWGHPIKNLARSVEQENPGASSEVSQSTDVEVACGCLWAIHGTKRLWHLSKNRDRFSDTHDWRGDLWTGEQGYSTERWEFWKRRFHDVAGNKMEGVGAETRRLAVAAITNMNAVDMLD